MEVTNASLVLIELGVVVIGLALLDRLARRFSISAIPLYLLVGLAFGNGGLVPLNFSEAFLHVGTEIGVLLLLFTLGLGYTGEQLRKGLKSGLSDGVVDFLFSFPPGFIVGLIMGWSPMAAWLLGGGDLYFLLRNHFQIHHRKRMAGQPRDPLRGQYFGV
jgi:monovalent cation:H+ antiporter-2, CPA2 family